MLLWSQSYSQQDPFHQNTHHSRYYPNEPRIDRHLQPYSNSSDTQLTCMLRYQIHSCCDCWTRRNINLSGNNTSDFSIPMKNLKSIHRNPSRKRIVQHNIHRIGLFCNPNQLLFIKNETKTNMFAWSCLPWFERWKEHESLICCQGSSNPHSLLYHSLHNNTSWINTICFKWY